MPTSRRPASRIPASCSTGRRWPVTAVGLWPPDAPAAPDDADGAAPGPGASGPAVAALQTGLTAYGYACPASAVLDAATEAAVIAFQRHYRPTRVDGRFDADCRRRLAWLLAALA